MELDRIRRNLTEWKNRCIVFRRMRERQGREREMEEREVEERGVFEALGIPKFILLRGITWYYKGIV